MDIQDMADYDSIVNYFIIQNADYILPIVITILCFGIVIVVLTVISMWRLFVKAGLPGWKAIIPGYNIYLCFKLWSKPLYFWIALAAYIANLLISQLVTPLVMDLTLSVLLAVLSFAASTVMIVFVIITLHGLSKSFGRGPGFTVGLVLVNVVFAMILAFGSSVYNPVNLNNEKENYAK